VPEEGRETERAEKAVIGPAEQASLNLAGAVSRLASVVGAPSQPHRPAYVLKVGVSVGKACRQPIARKSTPNF
jgi:hypothetical protein